MCDFYTTSCYILDWDSIISIMRLCVVFSVVAGTILGVILSFTKD